MTVKEVAGLLGSGVAFEIRGAYSGKVYHRSYVNSSKNLDKYAERECTERPFYSTLKLRGSETNEWCIPVVGIWMHDYDMRKE